MCGFCLFFILLGCGRGAGSAPATDPADTGGTGADCGAAESQACADVEVPGIEQFVPLGGTATGPSSPCTALRVVGAGAVNMTVEATVVVDWGAVAVTVSDPAGHELAQPGQSTVRFQLWQSGEFFVDVVPQVEGTVAQVTLSCVDGCERAFTRYPVVMMHGLGGAGVFDGVDYFFEVRDDLEARGYLVRNPSVEAFAASEDRAASWAEILQAYLDEGLGRKFILLAHSQGGLDARYLVSSLGFSDHVAVVDMVATPNHGTEVADVLSGTIESGAVDPAWVDLGSLAFASLYGLAEGEASLSAQMAFLTTENIAAFNENNPDSPDVYYASWAGLTCGSLEPTCQAERGGESVELLLEPLYLIMWAQGLDNDGMVPRYSAEWGDFQGELWADHADEIGQFEDTDNPAFDHRAFYLAEVERLAALGF